jgi:hypothetical protein
MNCSCNNKQYWVKPPDSEMTVKMIVNKFLKENKFHGLIHQAGICGCEIDDLFPCCEDGVENCLPRIIED